MKENNHIDKWHFLKVVDGLDELDRVRRQHQMQLETEDEHGIIFKCRGSAYCPYRMTFYHRQNAIYIRNAHNHDSIVPIVSRRTEQMDGGTGADGAIMDNIGINSSSSSANAEQQKSGPRRRLFSDLISSDGLSEEEKEREENSGGEEEKGKGEKGRKRREVEERKEREEEKEKRERKKEGQLEERQDQNEEEDRMEQDDKEEEEEEKGPNPAKQSAKRRTKRGKKSRRYWRSLGKISGAIDEVCREVCQLHFVRREEAAKNGKIFFKCPNWKCNYRTMIDAKGRLLYCRASHNHAVPSDDVSANAPAPSSPSVTACSPPHSLAQFSLSAASASSSASSLANTTGNEWLLIATRIFNRRAIAQFCRVHSLRQTICRAKRVYMRCVRFGNACSYRVIWHRSAGRVYHRGRHNHDKQDRSRAQQGRHGELATALRHDDNDSDGADKMPQLRTSNTTSVVSLTADETSPALSFVDKLGKKWAFLAKLDIFRGASSSRNTRSTAAAMAAIPFEQQLEQLCAERHLSRSRLSSSSTRIWLHCAQQRQLDVACPYRVVVHLPEGTIFHRLQHNHPVPYNLSDTEKENDQSKGSANANTKHRPSTSSKTSSTPPPSSPIVSTHRPETRSLAKMAKCADNVRANSSGRRPFRQAFVKARAAMKNTGGGGGGQNEEGKKEEDEEDDDEEDEDEEHEDGAVSSAADTDPSEYDTDHSPAYRTRVKMCSTWPRSEVRIKRDAFVKARASISSDVQMEKQQIPTDEPLTPSSYKFASKNWHFLADQIWHKRALTDFCKTNMLRIAGGIITNSYRNRMLCVRSGCPFRALWLNRQGLVYGLRRHNHLMTSKIRSVEKEEPVELFQLSDLEKEMEAMAQRHSLHFRVDNDVFVLMLRAEVGDQWLSRLLMLREDQSSIRLAEFTGCKEEFSEKAEHWLKADFDGRKQLIDALNTKCAEYFQQQGNSSSVERILPC